MVSRLPAFVTYHGLNRLFMAAIVAFTIAAIRARVWICANMDGAVLPHGTWHIHHDDGLAAAIYRIDMTIEEDIRADFLAVVGVVPEILHDFVRIIHALYMVLAIRLLHA